jgi:hypothetical protein
MGRVHRQRGEDGKHVVLEVLLQEGALVGGDRVHVQQVNAFLGQPGQHLLGQALVVLPLHATHDGRDRVQLIFRGHAIGGAFAETGGELLLEAGHPHLEELVEIGAEDRQELEALERGFRESRPSPRTRRLNSSQRAPGSGKGGVPQVGGNGLGWGRRFDVSHGGESFTPQAGGAIPQASQVCNNLGNRHLDEMWE